MAVDYPWPESQQRVEARVQALVGSVVRPHELRDVRLDWVTPTAHGWDAPNAGWVALRVTVAAGADEVFQRQVWGPDWHRTWEDELRDLASELEDWVCETGFGWGEQRIATVPQ